MALVRWEQSFSVNVRQFDEQHQKLVGMLNELHDAMKEGRSRQILEKIFGGLVDYTVTHFSAEEKLMKSTGYPRFAEHKSAHDKLTAAAIRLREDFRGGKSGVNMDLLNFLKSWLIEHIKGTDREYGAYFNARGIS